MPQEQSAWRQHAVSVAAELHPNMPWSELVYRLGDSGLLGLTLPAEYGGGERQLVDVLQAIEVLTRAHPAAGWPVLLSSIGPAGALQRFGTPRLKHLILPEVISGRETITGILSTSDTVLQRDHDFLHARVEADGVVISGEVRNCIAARYARHYVIYLGLLHATSIGAVVIDHNADGLIIEDAEPRSTFGGAPAADLVLHEVRVPADYVLVGPDASILSITAAIEQLGLASMAVGRAGATLHTALRQMGDVGQRSLDPPGVSPARSALDEMAIQVDASRALVKKVASAPRPSIRDAAIARSFASKVARNVQELACRIDYVHEILRSVGVLRFGSEHAVAHSFADGAECGGCVN